ncbi:unnamed protein product, partial [Pneumocystis jirovecii]
MKPKNRKPLLSYICPHSYRLAFLDIQPLSEGHALVIPKEHAEKMHELSDDSLNDLLPLAKRLVNAMDLQDYNILQNNGRLAHQVVNHVKTCNYRYNCAVNILK